MGVTILGMSEDEFWRSTPDKLVRLSKIHYEVNNPDKDHQPKADQPRKNGEIVSRGETQTFRKIE